MKVEGIAQYSSWKPIFGPFESGRFTQIFTVYALMRDNISY